MTYINKNPKNCFIFENEVGVLKRVNGRMFLFTKCSECCNFLRKVMSLSRMKKQARFYCDQKCLTQSQKTGVAKVAKEKSFMENYGVLNPSSSPLIKEQKKMTMIKRYGVENVSQIPEIKKEKSRIMKQMCKETDFLDRVKSTMTEKYGSHYLATKECRESLKNYAQETYGVDHVMKSQVHIKERNQKFFEKHGVENPLQIVEIKEKVRKTCLKLYGVDNVFKRPDVIENRIKKLVENSKRASSGGEDKIYETLCKEFKNVERHNAIFYRTQNFWIIDFYLPDQNVYIEYDGIYWHGIGKLTEDLKILSKKGDRTAKMQLQAHKKTKFQNSWFHKRNMKLFRIIEGTPDFVWLNELQTYINHGNIC